MMLSKLQNRPLWFRLWALSVYFSLFNYLIKLLSSEPTQIDSLIYLYAMVSLVVYRYMLPEEEDETDSSE